MEPYADATTALKKLRDPFLPHQISKLPKPTKAQTEAVKADYTKGIRCEICGTWHHPKVVHLDYVGHAALTDRLLDTDPLWFWEPMARDAEGLPKFDKDGGLWINLTVCGVQRPGYGHAGDKKGGDATKEIIGDALRNAAMRFGAALDLWHKGDLHADEEPEAQAKKPEQQPTDRIPTEDVEAFADLSDRLYVAFKTAGKLESHPSEAEKWRKRFNSDPSSVVIPKMREYVERLEEAAKKVSAQSAPQDQAA